MNYHVHALDVEAVLPVEQKLLNRGFELTTETRLIANVPKQEPHRNIANAIMAKLLYDKHEAFI